MGFDYKYTCPLIDDIRDELLGELTETISKHLKDVIHTDIYYEILDAMISSVTYSSDKFRDVNSDMRNYAEEYISDLEEEINTLKEELEK